MSETIILTIIVCSCIVAVSLIIGVCVLIYNYQDNSFSNFSYNSLKERCNELDLRFDEIITRVTKLEIYFDNLKELETNAKPSRNAIQKTQLEENSTEINPNK